LNAVADAVMPAADVPHEGTPNWQESRWWRGHIRAQQRVLEILAPTPLRRAVDIGCGSGYLCLALALSHPRASVVGVEPDGASVLAANALFATVPERDLSAVPGDAWSVPVADASADLVSMVSVLHWLYPRQAEALRESRRILVPGGQFLLANMVRKLGVRQFTDLVDSFVFRAAAALGISLSPERGAFTRRHHTIAGLCGLLESEGFEVEQTRTWLSRRRFDAGADLVAFIDRTMKTYYWQGLPDVEVAALKSELVARFDAEPLLRSSGFRIVNGVVRARRRSSP
jgi:SAM-dependent methyltransferase